MLFPLLSVAIGMLLLVAGAEWLVRGASRLALAAGVSALVVGLTVVSFGTSAPEMAVSIFDAASGAGQVAIGNAVGSNVFNVLMAIGVAALFGDLVVHQRVVRIDVPLVVAATAVVWWLASDGVLSVTEGVMLFAGVIAYTVVTVVLSRRDTAAVAAEYEEAFGAPEPLTGRSLLVAPALLLGGLAGLVSGSQLLVRGASDLAATFGVPDVVVGLTVVAIGTSLPELVTSVVAVRRGELDIAVGNVIGSNLFNLLAVLGAAAVAGGGLNVPRSVVTGDLPVAFITMLVALPVLAIELRVHRWEGVLLVAGYVAYVTVAVLVGTASSIADTAQTLLLVGLSVLALLILVVGALTRSREPAT